MSDSKYPEHDKLRDVKDQSQACGEFLDWLLGEKGWMLAKYHENGVMVGQVCHQSNNDLLAEFFGIDQVALENEKRAMLDELRALNAS